jgi:predicted DNA-binding protein
MPTFTMRLPDEDYEDLQAMALLTGRSMADLVRDAVAASLTEFASPSNLDQRYEEELRARDQAFERLKQRQATGRREAVGHSGH